jgi:hypothetical protein
VFAWLKERWHLPVVVDRSLSGRGRWQKASGGHRWKCSTLAARRLHPLTVGMMQPAGRHVRFEFQLKFAIAGPQPIPCIQTFWTPSISGARSVSETIIWAVNDSSFPSPCR